MDNQKGMDKFLETYNLLRLNHEEIENKNKPIISEKIKSALKNFPTKAQKQMLSLVNFTKHLKKN